MAENYSEAAVRHFLDAEHLAKASRWGNAGHLVGFAAECAVKSRLRILKPAAEAKEFHGHFPDLINIARKQVCGRRDTALHAVLKINLLMQGWNVNDRYAANSSIGKVQYDLWRQHASRLMSAAGLNR
jgi:hypothetical protein